MSYNNAVDIRTLMLDLDRKRTDREKALHPTARERAVEATQQVIDAYASALKGEFANASSLSEDGWFNTFTTLSWTNQPVFWHTYYMLQDKGFRAKIAREDEWRADVILIRV